MDLDDFIEEFSEKKYDDIYTKILNKSLVIIKSIANIRGIFIEEIDLSNKQLIEEYKKQLDINCGYFLDITYLIDELINWNDNYSIEEKEKNIDIFIRVYNLLQYDLDDYYNIQEEIKEYGFEEISNQRINKVMEIFKDLLNQRDIKYDNDLSFSEFASLIINAYPMYNEAITNVLNAINLKIVKYDNDETDNLTNEEIIMFIDELYEELTVYMA